jgi:hypothetical protein
VEIEAFCADLILPFVQLFFVPTHLMLCWWKEGQSLILPDRWWKVDLWRWTMSTNFRSSIEPPDQRIFGVSCDSVFGRTVTSASRCVAVSLRLLFTSIEVAKCEPFVFFLAFLFLLLRFHLEVKLLLAIVEVLLPLAELVFHIRQSLLVAAQFSVLLSLFSLTVSICI